MIRFLSSYFLFSWLQLFLTETLQFLFSLKKNKTKQKSLKENKTFLLAEIKVERFLFSISHMFNLQSSRTTAMALWLIDLHA